ncbi:MAG: acyl-CoA carboxylase subunit epsilon [Microbacterium sp.]
MTESIDMRVQITRGTPTPEELAALIAVVGEAYDAEAQATVVDERSASIGWRTSRRLRRVPTRGARWGAFTG